MGVVTLEWFGCTTFRLRVAGVTLLLDAYFDKAPNVEPRPSVSDITDLDYVLITHAHFDHMVDAGAAAKATGATVVANYEAIRVLRAEGVADDQLLPASGGETIDCGSGVSVAVLPGLHSCLFAASQSDSAIPCLGDLEISLADRRRTVRQLFGALETLDDSIAGYFERTSSTCSAEDGGQLNYLITTPSGSIFLNASSGYWSRLIDGIAPDLALIALTGRPNVDGEPHQGSLADFLAEEVTLLGPKQIALCHHDALLPPLTPPTETSEALRRLAAEHPRVRQLTFEPCVETVVEL